MTRLSRASVINDIERIVRNAAVGKHRWETNGVECVLDRHSYYAEKYSFDIGVLRVRMITASPGWELYLVTEFWRDEAGEAVRMTKWLKLATGRSADVLKWIRENRDVTF